MRTIWIFLSTLVLNGNSISMKLENDKMCGITTGGKEECHWDCEASLCLLLPNFTSPIYSDPECLTLKDPRTGQ